MGDEVDHEDRNSLNDKINNLRKASSSQNKMNQSVRCDNELSIRGVWLNKLRQKYCTQICVNNHRINLGEFDKLEDAKKARKEAEKKYFGEFAPK